MKIFATSMTVEVVTTSDNFQLELLAVGLQSEVELKKAFKTKGLLNTWYRVPEGKYPYLIDNSPENASIFGSTYIRQTLFIKMIKIKNQYRNRLTDNYSLFLTHLN